MNKKYLLIIISICLIGTLLLGVNYLMYKNHINSSLNNSVDKEEINNTENDIEEEKITKIYPEKDFVYDTNYSYNFQNEMTDSSIKDGNYTIENLNNPLTFVTKETKQNANAIKVPFINIKNDDIAKINEDIKNLYMKNAQVIDESRACMEELCPYLTLTYKTIENKNTNTLTILILNYEGEASVPVKKIYGYVIDLTNGKLLNLDDIAKKVNLNANSLKEKTINKIKYYLDNYNEDNVYNLDESINYYDNNIKSFNNYCSEDNLQSGLIYYIDESGISIITNLVYNNAEFISGMFTFKLDN